MRIPIFLHSVIDLESYLKCTVDLACTSRPPNLLVYSVCVMWCEPVAQQLRTRNESSCKW